MTCTYGSLTASRRRRVRSATSGRPAIDIIDRQFAAENAHDVEGTLATYTDDIVRDDITHPDSPFHGKEDVGSVYAGIIDAIPDVHVRSVKRFGGEDGRHVVDESIITGHVENAWLDAAEVRRQIEAWNP